MGRLSAALRSAPRSGSQAAMLGVFLSVLAAVGVWVSDHWPEVSASLGEVPALTIVVLAGAQVLCFVMRTSAWGWCLRCTGARVRPPVLHGASAATNLCCTVVPGHVGGLLRVAILASRPEPGRPTVPQLATSDAVLVVVDLAFTLLIIAAGAGAIGLAWWVPVAPAALLLLALALLLALRERLPPRIARATPALSLPDLAAVSFLVGGPVLVQPLRFWIALGAAGAGASLADAVLSYAVASALATLPLGPASSIGGVAIVLGAGMAAPAAAAGILLSATAFIAAAIYLAGALLIASAMTLPRRARAWAAA